MESKLRSLLDKIYELEGLVHLAIKRDDSLDDFIRLIAKKGEEVGDISKTLKKDETHDHSDSSEESAHSSFDEYSIDDSSESLPLIKEIEEAEEKEKENDYGKFNESGIVNEHQKGKLVFSINDRFRFRKELFDNSDADFNNTLALVASMESYEEAEDYFINEEGFNPQDAIVKEFMDIIKRYFK